LARRRKALDEAPADTDRDPKRTTDRSQQGGGRVAQRSRDVSSEDTDRDEPTGNGPSGTAADGAPAGQLPAPATGRNFHALRVVGSFLQYEDRAAAEGI